MLATSVVVIGMFLGSASGVCTPERIRALVDHLPIGENIYRDQADHGLEPDGVEQPWMPLMRELGIRHAVLKVRFDFSRARSNLSVAKIELYSDYGVPASRIKERRVVHSARDRGLLKMLENSALERARRFLLIELNRIGRERIVGTLYPNFVDDPCVPNRHIEVILK